MKDIMVSNQEEFESEYDEEYKLMVAIGNGDYWVDDDGNEHMEE